MLISVCQGTFNGAHAFQGTAIQIANFIQMKGACVCRFCFRGLLRVRSLRSMLFVWVRCKGALFPSFAVIVCAWVRLHACTLFEAVYLPFKGLLLLLQYFAHLARFRAFMWLVLYCSLFCAPPVRRFNDSGGQRLMKAGVKATRRRGAFYSLRSPSASLCSFSAIR